MIHIEDLPFVCGDKVQWKGVRRTEKGIIRRYHVVADERGLLSLGYLVELDLGRYVFVGVDSLSKYEESETNAAALDLQE